MRDPSGRIFLSYRREDTRHVAGRLSDRLKTRFPNTQVFMDVDAILPGADFVEAIAKEIGASDVVIALIGPSWLVLDPRSDEPRLHAADDFVALELRAAIDRRIPVVPVLVDQATMPSPDVLPTHLRTLATKQAARLDHETFASDVGPLLTATESILHATHERRRSTPPQRPAERTGMLDRGMSQSAPRAIPAGRAALRILLWWVTSFLALFASSGVFMTITGRITGPIAVGLVGVALICGVLAAVVVALRREIIRQRRILGATGPDDAERLAGSAVSARHVRIVAIVCAVICLGFGLAVALTPPSTGSPQPTSSAR